MSYYHAVCFNRTLRCNEFYFCFVVQTERYSRSSNLSNSLLLSSSQSRSLSHSKNFLLTPWPTKRLHQIHGSTCMKLEFGREQALTGIHITSSRWLASNLLSTFRIIHPLNSFTVIAAHWPSNPTSTLTHLCCFIRRVHLALWCKWLHLLELLVTASSGLRLLFSFGRVSQRWYIFPVA